MLFNKSMVRYLFVAMIAVASNNQLMATTARPAITVTDQSDVSELKDSKVACQPDIKQSAEDKSTQDAIQKILQAGIVCWEKGEKSSAAKFFTDAASLSGANGIISPLEAYATVVRDDVMKKKLLACVKVQKEAHARFDKAIYNLIQADLKEASENILAAAELSGYSCDVLYNQAIDILEQQADPDSSKISEDQQAIAQYCLIQIYTEGFGPIQPDTCKVIQWTLFSRAKQINAERARERVAVRLFAAIPEEGECAIVDESGVAKAKDQEKH